MWSTELAYAELARATGHTKTMMILRESPSSAGVETSVELDFLLLLHREWSTYVIGLADEPPPSRSFSRSNLTLAFTRDEYGHMADVRNVFRGAEVAGAVAFVAGAVLIYLARREGRALMLVRAAGIGAAAVVALAGLAAAVAFEPLFLLFHEVFFPQGNFLFDPATSNLLRLYPEWYWSGVTVGVAGSFVCIALASAGAAQIGLRRRSDTYTRAA